MNFINKFAPKDIIAKLLVAVMGVYLSKHPDWIKPDVMMTIIGYYFGHRTSGVDDGQ